MDVAELASLGYEAHVGADVRLWVPNAGRPHEGAAESGWAQVVSIGEPVSLGDGIGAPTAAAAPVMATFATTRSARYAFDLGRGHDRACESIEMTATHPVWCEGRGRWIAAGALKIGDRVRAADGSATVTGILLVRSGAVSDNLTVAGGATFFVGEGGVWVHNCWAGLHHLIPKYLGGLEGGTRRYLTHAQHVEIHRYIDEAGEAFGIPKRSGTGGGTAAVQQWVRDTGPALATHQIHEALITAYRRFDSRHGTNLTGDLLAEMARIGR